MGSRGSSRLPPAVLLLLTLQVLLFISQAPRSSAASFICNSTASSPCQALIDYTSPNSTKLSSVISLFSINNSLTVLGANGFPPSTSSNLTIGELQTIRISFPCTCTSDGTGISNRTPIYTVQPGDGLDHIAVDVFSRLVTYQEIAAVNNIPNVNNITIGQKLWIPLPCSCDEVGGVRVVHYGHLVEAGSTLAGIAEKYGTTEDTLKSLNGIVNASSLQADQVLDVPLRACNSSVSTDSVDYPLLVANGTYVYTANNCVRCKCDSANNWTLDCEPSGLKPSSNWSTCPAMHCGSLSLSNTTTSSCSRSTCSYAGFYSNQTISTTLVTESTCTPPASSPGPRTTMRSSSWNFLLTLLLFLLCLYPFL